MTEYPSDETLKIIREWDVVKQGIMPLVHFVIESWHWEEYAILKGKVFELHTGGWSGNEDIIKALNQNLMFWSICWMKSVRGGHYYFEV